MSGHSKWSKIKHKKGIADAKRGKMFTKLGRAITIAASEGGGDMESNFSLRLAVEKARKSSMPANNIERAIKRGTGELADAAVLEKAVYGGYGSDGVAIVVDVMTDNKNRTVSDLRKIFSEHGGRLAEASSVLWQFQEQGRILVKCSRIEKAEKFGKEDKEIAISPDEVIMAVMEVDCIEDVSSVKSNECNFCEIMTKACDLSKVCQDITELGYVVESMELTRVPENKVELSDVDKQKVAKLLAALNEYDDVDKICVNSDV
ncbi:MAG: YebC/PmpR family DNA-binding transcriptional regulator [Patescibacteria group bacterium]|nr:YebC/PmpR family DNA-binding transcriptional regulator [Patescibacteria group bacterium]